MSQLALIMELITTRMTLSAKSAILPVPPAPVNSTIIAILVLLEQLNLLQVF